MQNLDVVCSLTRLGVQQGNDWPGMSVTSKPHRIWARRSPGQRMALLFACALAIRLLAILYLGISEPPLPEGDDWHYDLIAHRFVSEGVYENLWFPPGYPLFLSGIYLLAGHSMAAVRVAQAILGAATVCLAYSIGRDLFGSRVAMVGALLLAFFPAHIYMSSRIMAEVLYACLIAASVLAASRFTREPTAGKATGVSLALGAATLVKSNLYPLPPILLFLLSIEALRSGSKRLVRVAALWLPMLAVVMSPNLLNVALEDTQIAVMPVNSGHTLWWSNNPVADGYFAVNPENSKEAKELAARYGLLEAISAGEGERFDARSAARSGAYRKLALYWIRDNPVEFVKLCRAKLVNAFSPWPRAMSLETSKTARITYALTYGGLLPFMVVGLVLSIPEWRRCWVVYLVLLSYVAMVLIFYGTPRFTVIIAPYLLIFAALSLVRSWNFLREKWT